MPPTGRRGDIEGLRALAVVLVVAYHCGLPGIRGGFVGVDAFFALSGYLMTGLLLDEHRRTGRIHLLAFYARRVRRLLPAAAVATLATLVAGAIILDPLSLRRLAGDVVSVATYSANIRFARQGTDYLQSDLAVSPLLHFWSLAVEEQFYLLWPMLLAFAARGARRHRVAIVLGAVSAASLAFSLALTPDQPVWSFFGLHTRAFEFGVGGLALLLGRSLGHRALRVRAVTGWIGLAAIIVAATTFDTGVGYPGWRALVPVLGTVAALDAVVARRGPRVVLDRRVAVWLGGRSYSIYLWHWPALVLVPVALDREISTREAVVVALAAGIVAVAVQHLVEDPLRHARRLVARQAASYAMGIAVTAALLVSATVVARTNDLEGSGDVAGEPAFVDGVLDTGDKNPGSASTDDDTDDGTDAGTDDGTDDGERVPQPVPSNLEPALADVAADQPSIYATQCHLDIPAVIPSDCRIGDGSRTIALLGDSHAAQWFPALEVIATENDASVVVMTKSGCPAASVTVWNDILKREYDQCDRWREQVLSRLEADPPDVVVMANYPRHILTEGRVEEGRTHERLWRNGVLTTLRRLHATGAKVLLIGPIPRSAGRRPECVASHLDDVTRCRSSRRKSVQQPYLDIERRAATEVGVGFVDPTDWLCDERRCPAVVGRYLVYRDSSHITTPFSRALAPELEPYVIDGLDGSAQ